MTDAVKNAAAIGARLASRSRAFRSFYARRREGWQGVARFIARVAEDFTKAEDRAAFHYDWDSAVEKFVDRLFDLSKQGLLIDPLVYAAASESISATEICRVPATR